MATHSGEYPGRYDTREGMLVRGAVLARAGELDYTRAEVGLPGEGMVKVVRTIDTLSDPETLRSLRNAPLTVGHPPDKLVTPENWSKWVDGSVIGEPWVVGNEIVGDVMLGSQRAIDAYNRGERELSVGGYPLKLQARADGRLESRGALQCNHVAQVRAGRAGSGVRVFDISPTQEPPSMATESGAAQPGPTQIQADQAVAAALARFFPQLGLQVDQTANNPAVAQLSADVKALTDKIAEQEQKKAADEAAAAAEQKIADAKAEGIAAERDRQAVIAQVSPMLSVDQRVQLAGSNATAKDILVAALQNRVADAANQPVEYLRGVLTGIVQSRQQQAQQLTAQDQSALAGVTNAFGGGQQQNQFGLPNLGAGGPGGAPWMPHLNQFGVAPGLGNDAASNILPFDEAANNPGAAATQALAIQHKQVEDAYTKAGGV